MMQVKLLILCFIISSVFVNGLAKRFEPTWESLDTHVAPTWYDEAKLGIFMHWGLYSVPSFGSEWFWEEWKGTKTKEYVEFMEKNYAPTFQYPDFAPQWTAEFFDPSAWADLVQASGAKYYVITSKHHEGFTLWRSNVSWNWNAVDAGPHRDIIQELSDAIRNRTDVHFGMYFSQFDWFHPLFKYDQQNKFATQEYPKKVSLPQLHDLVSKYKPEYIWSDGDWDAGPEYWNSLEFLAWLYNDSPVRDNILVNDRWGAGTACKHGDVKNCHDKYDPHSKQAFKWEDATTLDKSSWGYRRTMNIADVQPIEDIIKLLIRTVSLGGNLLLNVGPTHDGRIVPIFQERLLQLGSWMKINGDAIYASKPWRVYNDTEESIVWESRKQTKSNYKLYLFFKYSVPQNVYVLGLSSLGGNCIGPSRYTSKGSYVYALMTEWPENGAVTLHAPIPSTLTTVTMLGNPAHLTWYGKFGVSGLQIDVHKMRKRPCDWSWVFQLEHVK